MHDLTMTHHVFIIAEAGVNHNGSLSTACELVDAAAYAGADAVKIQTFKAERVVSAQAPKAKYQLKSTDPAESQLEMLRKLSFPESDYPALMKHCSQRGIEFLSTPYNEEDVDFLVEAGVKRIKLASISAAEPGFVRYVARTGLPFILSTGMANLAEIEKCLQAAREIGNQQITLLQCTTNYPSSIEDANLRAMKTLREAFGVAVGYSDHTQTDTACIAATALGAEVIEKHLTLDQQQQGPDHACSENPEGFARLVKKIREAHVSLGTPEKKPTAAEEQNIAGMRRSLMTRHSLKAGDRIKAEDLILKRPGTGLPAIWHDEIVGRIVQHDLPDEHFLLWSDLGDKDSDGT